jgi:hypothetical protein
MQQFLLALLLVLGGLSYYLWNEKEDKQWNKTYHGRH